ncbi:VOC family protein [Halopseudomonas pelagia]|uniref:VOC family protein n=1 Tax=Halopseudomonas pelagia TaxID=553151 RepID=UPI0030D7685E|tara:strand:+ start:58580 stop:59572 length:993 start_codon:yes stop_codon:yes gene_type:complete
MKTDIFGASGLGYVVIESERIDPWRSFLEDGIGMHCQFADQACLAFRMDKHLRRLIIKRGPAEDFAAVGWQLRDQATLDVVLERLSTSHIAVQEGSAAEAAERGVKRFWRLVGPKRLAIELFFEPLTTNEALNMRCAGFVTGEQFMGHLAITTRRAEDMRRFWEEIFDARFSDSIVEQLAGVTLDIDFFRVNPRHHSIAIARVRGLPIDPIRTRAQHMNLLTSSVADLTAAFLRCRKLGFEMAHEIGEHPNDREQSFYVISPSGFEVELGWNPLTVDERTWQPTTYQGISLWGHKPPKTGLRQSIATNGGNLVRGLRSLRKPEYSPFQES